MTMASRLIDLISKETNLHVQHCLSLAVVLHNYNAVLYD